MAPPVEIRNLTFTYPGIDGKPPPGAPPLIEGVCFSLESGQRCLLVGSNGAGKTTILKILGGKHMVDPSMVRVFGRSAFHDTALTSSGDLCYLGGEWRRDVAFAGYQVNIQMDISAEKMLFGVTDVDPQRRDELIKLAHLVSNVMNVAGNAVKASPVKPPFAANAKPGSSIQPSVTSCRIRTLRHDFRISGQHTPRLGPYEVLKYPHFTEATVRDVERQNMLVLIVDVRADKGEIKAAVQDILGVKVEKVNTLIRPDGKKKAFVQLTPVYSAEDALLRGKHSSSD